MKFAWRTLLGLAVSGGLLWWVFRGTDLGLVVRQIREADPFLLTAAAGMATGSFLIRALRWRVLLQPIAATVGLGSRFAAVSIGFMANNLLPLRVGEFARAYALSRLEPVRTSGAFASLVVERFLDSLAIVALLLVAASLPSFPADAFLLEGALGTGLRWALGLLGILVVFLLTLLVFPRRAVALLEALVAPFPEAVARPVVSALEAFLDGLTVLRRPGLLARAGLWSLVLWGWHAGSFWVGFRAFGIDLGYGPALLVNATTAFAAAIPSAPGFFGTFHAGALVGLTGVYGVERTLTLSFAVGYHLAGFIPVTLIGLWYLWHLGITLAEVQASETTVEAAVEARTREAEGRS